MTTTETKQHPILFSTPMVDTILKGSKTMTRRVVKPQPPCSVTHIRGLGAEYVSSYPNGATKPFEFKIKFPYGNIGDTLWVREVVTNDSAMNEPPIWVYKADYPNYTLNSGQRWKSPRFMPKIACRLFLKITDVRVERLQDISEEDAIAEGISIDQSTYPNRLFNYKTKQWVNGGFPSVAFQSLWQSINGEESWNSNPFVWCISFERIEKPL